MLSLEEGSGSTRLRYPFHASSIKDKQLRQIKAWYETKKGDGTISAESEEVLKEILTKGKILKKAIDEKVK